MAKIIEVTVSPKGETTIQAKGFTGDQCRDATRNLEAALGVRTHEQLTDEFHATTASIQEARQ